MFIIYYIHIHTDFWLIQQAVIETVQLESESHRAESRL